MKTIALIGAPGAGKTKLMEALIARYEAGEPKCENCPPVAVGVDSYAQEVCDNGEYAIGLDGGYMANISIAVQRYNTERIIGHRVNPKVMITCGTVVETAVYTAMYFEKSLSLTTSEEDKLQEAQRFQACTGMLATLYMDTFKYERAFYLPSPTKPEDERWVTFERNLQAAFQAYQSPIAPLVIEEFTDADDLTQKRMEKIIE